MRNRIIVRHTKSFSTSKLSIMTLNWRLNFFNLFQTGVSNHIALINYAKNILKAPINN